MILRRRPDLRRPPVDDLAKYERDRDSEGYRQRMMNNLLAFGVLCFIVYCGIWLTSTMAQLRKDQDCVLTGRTNSLADKDTDRTALGGFRAFSLAQTLQKWLPGPEVPAMIERPGGFRSAATMNV